MKRSTFLIALTLVLAANFIIVFGQKRPAVKPKTTVTKSKPAEKTTTETEEAAPTSKPTPKSTAVSPAQMFFNEGLNCDAKDYDCQISNYTKAINLELKTKEVFKNRGNAYLQRKDFDKAIADFSKLIELDLNDANSYKNRGRIYLENSNSPQAVNAAVRDFTSAIDLEPKDKEAFILRAKAHFSLGDFEKGRSDLASAVQLDPTNTELLKYQAKIYSLSEDYDKAIEIYSKIIAFQPNNAEPLIERGKLYESIKKLDLAAKDYNRAKEIEPKNPLSNIALAELFEKNRKFDEAIKELTKAVELTPTNTDLLFKRAKLYGQLNKHDEAIADVTKVIELSPRNAEAYEFRCKIEKDTGNLQKAVQDCSIASSLNADLIHPDFFWWNFIADKYGLGFNQELSNQSSQILIELRQETKVTITDFTKNNRIKAAIELRKSPTALNFTKAASAQFGIDGQCWTSVSHLNPSPLYCSIAESYYTKAIELDPTLAEAYAGRAVARFELLNVAIGASQSDYNGIIAVLEDAQKAVTLDSSQIEKLKIFLPSFRLVGSGNYGDLSWGPKNVIITKMKINILDEAIRHQPSNMELYYLRATLKPKVGSAKLDVESDLRQAIALYTSSRKFPKNRKIFIESIKSLSSVLVNWGRAFKDNPTYYEDFIEKEKKFQSAWQDVFNEMFEKYPNVYELYEAKCKKLNSPADCTKGSELKKLYLAELMKNNEELLNAWRYGATFVKNLTTVAVAERNIESDFDNQLRLEETQRIEQEDTEAKKVKENYSAQAEAFSAKVQRDSEAIKQRIAEINAKRKAETMNALFGLINTTVEAATNNRRSTSQTPQPNNSSRQQTTQSGNTNNSSSSTSANNGTTAQNDPDFPAAMKGNVYINQSAPGYRCINGTNTEQCWGNWRMDGNYSQIQYSVLGPVQNSYNAVDNTPNVKSQVWHIQVKNTSNSIVEFKLKVVFGDGKETWVFFAIPPGGTAYKSDFHTLSAAGTVGVGVEKLRSCINFTSVSNGYRCEE